MVCDWWSEQTHSWVRLVAACQCVSWLNLLSLWYIFLSDLSPFMFEHSQFHYSVSKLVLRFRKEIGLEKCFHPSFYEMSLHNSSLNHLQTMTHPWIVFTKVVANGITRPKTFLSLSTLKAAKSTNCSVWPNGWNELSRMNQLTEWLSNYTTAPSLFETWIWWHWWHLMQLNI